MTESTDVHDLNYFYMRIELEFSVPYLDRNTTLTDQEIIDRVSATIILQTFMEMKQP